MNFRDLTPPNPPLARGGTGSVELFFELDIKYFCSPSSTDSTPPNSPLLRGGTESVELFSEIDIKYSSPPP